MSIEITGEHTGMVGEVDLTGHTTYQFSLNLADPADQVLTVFGNTENPTEIVAPAGYCAPRHGIHSRHQRRSRRRCSKWRDRAGERRPHLLPDMQ